MKPEFTHQIIDPQIFPLEIVIDASYWLINRLVFRIEGDPNKEISVHIKPRFKETSNKQAQILFDDALIQSFVSRYNWDANSKIRHHFIHAALSWMPYETNMWTLKDKDEIPDQVDYQMSQDPYLEFIVVSFDIRDHNLLDALLPRLFSMVTQLLPVAHFTTFRIKNGKLTFKITPKNGFQMDKLKAKLHGNFNTYLA